RAPGEFTDVAGSDTLFNFNRTTEQSTLPVIRSRPFGQRNRPTRQLRPSAPVGLGDLRSSQPFGSLVRPPVAGGGYLNQPFITTRESADTLTGRVAPSIGGIEQPDGRLIELRASPLLGLRRQAIQPMEQPALLPPDMLTPPPELVPDELDEQTGGRGVRPIDAAPLPPGPVAPAVPGPGQPRADLSLQIGRQLQMMVEPDRAGLGAQRVEDHISQIELALFSPLGSHVARPGEDVYMDLLTQLKRWRDLRAGRPVEPLPTEPPPQPEAAMPSLTLPEPSEDQLRAAEAARVRATRLAHGLPAEPTDSEDRDTDQTDQGAEIPGSVAELLEALSQYTPAVSTFAGKRDDLVNDLLRQAETTMADGRYFDAQTIYLRILRLVPDQPMARVGLMHAQIGAGLFRSAAYNLRKVFEAHPELIGVRYTSNILPDSQRLDIARRDLEQMIDLVDRQEPALLLAYLGFQTDNPKLIAYALDLAQTRKPLDPLIPLLRHIWLEQHSPTAEPAIR
ncbi:MAG: hypothetical protein V3U29_08835, partial [Phycisphaeraceae bacterium]